MPEEAAPERKGEAVTPRVFREIGTSCLGRRPQKGKGGGGLPRVSREIGTEMPWSLEERHRRKGRR